MFTPEERARRRSAILEFAAADRRITGGAITGSAAAGHEDRWSDIDLAFGVGDAGDMPAVLSGWTAFMYEQHAALHHLDVAFGAWTYRVFLLRSALQVDLAFVPESEFRALAPAFHLVFGKTNEPGNFPVPPPAGIIGMGWLHALHACACIGRGKLWQAEYMISGVRNRALTLACLRHGLSTDHGRGFDLLPDEVTAQFEGSLVRELETTELLRAFRVAMRALAVEIRAADADLADRLAGTLASLTSDPDPSRIE